MTQEEDAVTSPAPSGGDRLNWRDMLRALEKSEDNIVGRLKAEFGPTILLVGDHEARLRTLEQNGSREAREAVTEARAIAVDHSKLVTRVSLIEEARKSEADVRIGMYKVFNLSRKSIMGIALGLVAISAGISVIGDWIATALGLIH